MTGDDLPAFEGESDDFFDVPAEEGARGEELGLPPGLGEPDDTLRGEPSRVGREVPPKPGDVTASGSPSRVGRPVEPRQDPNRVGREKVPPPMPEDTDPKPKPKREKTDLPPRRPWLTVAAGTGIVVGLGAGGYFWNDARLANQQVNEAKATADQSVAAAEAAKKKADDVEKNLATQEERAKLALEQERARLITLADNDRQQTSQEHTAKIAEISKKAEGDVKAADKRAKEREDVAAEREKAASKKADDDITKARGEAEAKSIKDALDRSPASLVDKAKKAQEKGLLPEAAQLYNQAAEAQFNAGDRSKTVELARKAREAAREAKNPSLEAEALELIASVLADAGPDGLREALQACDEGLEIEGLDDEHRATLEVRKSLLNPQAPKAPPANPGGGAALRGPLPAILVAIQAPDGPVLLAEIEREIDKVTEKIATAKPNSRYLHLLYRLRAKHRLDAARFYSKAPRPDFAHARSYGQDALRDVLAGRDRIIELAMNGKAKGADKADLAKLNDAETVVRAFIAALPTDNLAEVLRRVQDDLAKAKEESKKLGKENGDLKTKNTELTTANTKYKTSNTELTTANTKYKTSNTELTSKNSTLSRERDQVRGALAKLDSGRPLADKTETLALVNWLGGRLKALAESDRTLSGLAEAIAAREVDPKAPLLPGPAPTADQRLASDPRVASSWRARLLAAVDSLLDSRRGALQEGKLWQDKFTDRGAWIGTAKEVAGVVQFQPPTPPQPIDSTVAESAATGAWRSGLVSKVRVETARAKPYPVPALRDELKAWAEYGDGLLALRESYSGDAIASFSEAVRLDPRQPRYHYLLALALHRTGHLAEAEAEARDGQALDTESLAGPYGLDRDLAPFQDGSRKWLDTFRKTGHGPRF